MAPLILSPWAPQAVVLGAGDFPRHRIPLDVLEQSPRVVCCDGAAQAYIRHTGHLPWRIVGDGDSLPDETKNRCADIFVHIAEQESNDQTKATRYLLAQGLRRVAYVGVTGGREDHTLANIALLAEYHQMGIEARMYTNSGVFVLPSECRIRFAAPLGTPVSVFSFGTSGLRATGLQWPLRDFARLWQGALNRTCASCVEIEAEGCFIVFIPWQYE